MPTAITCTKDRFHYSLTLMNEVLFSVDRYDESNTSRCYQTKLPEGVRGKIISIHALCDQTIAIVVRHDEGDALSFCLYQVDDGTLSTVRNFTLMHRGIAPVSPVYSNGWFMVYLTPESLEDTQSVMLINVDKDVAPDEYVKCVTTPFSAIQCVTEDPRGGFYLAGMRYADGVYLDEGVQIARLSTVGSEDGPFSVSLLEATLSSREREDDAPLTQVESLQVTPDARYLAIIRSAFDEEATKCYHSYSVIDLDKGEVVFNHRSNALDNARIYYDSVKGDTHVITPSQYLMYQPGSGSIVYNICPLYQCWNIAYMQPIHEDDGSITRAWLVQANEVASARMVDAPHCYRG